MRYINLFIGIFLLVNAIWVSIVSNMHSGVFAIWAFALLFLLLGAFYPQIPVLLKCIFYVGTALALAAVLFLLLWGKTDTVNYDEDALVVLGAGLRGENPSKSLAARLDAALEYYEKNPDVLIVVSGGQGSDELISEALAMERYLTERGVPIQSIIKEDLSTSTAENFSFSKKLLDERFEKAYTVAYATSDYHIFRAGLIARSCGIENDLHINGCSPWYTVIPGALRECMAVVNFLLLE